MTMQYSQKEWTTHTKSALKAWHQPLKLADHPLTQLAIVQTERTGRPDSNEPGSQARALRDLLKRAISAIAPPDASPPTSDDAMQWLDPTWRSWSLLTLLYSRHMTRGLVQARIGMAEGGHYYQALRRAIADVAQLLQSWELAAAAPDLSLVWPGGAVRLDDSLYIERESDAELARLLHRPGQTVTIRGARQVGKTSLLVRGVELASGQGRGQLAYIDMQALTQDDLATYDNFLLLIAEWLLDELDLDLAIIEPAWQSRLGAARKLTRLIERHVLTAAGSTLVLALDEVDRLVLTEYGSDFFGLLRSWHNLRSRNPLWEKLTVLMAISTEPYLLIEDLQQSPFNVGVTLHLRDFDRAEVVQLAKGHSLSLDDSAIDALVCWTGGQPYLTRLALYTLVEKGVSLEVLMAASAESTSPFTDHLNHLHRLLRNDPALADGMRSVLHNPADLAEAVGFRLLQAGLIQQEQGSYRCRCELYRDYFGRIL